MYGTKLCLGLMGGLNVDSEEQIRALHMAGFDGFFSGWNKSIFKYRELADKFGMIYQSIHAPFANTDKIWKGGPDGDKYTNELIACVEDCAKVNVPILVVHPYSSFTEFPGTTEVGLENFRKIVKKAEELGVKIAIENVHHPKLLDELFEEFKGNDAVGFCWDTGHEMCYTYGDDHIAKYGDRLIATHINDNLGKTRHDEELTWHDDLHLLPFDGIIDWKDVCDRLNACGYNGILTFELNKNSRPNRYDNEKYAKMGYHEYIAECYNRACRIAYMKNGFKKG